MLSLEERLQLRLERNDISLSLNGANK